jgi:hypothetical protein
MTLWREYTLSCREKSPKVQRPRFICEERGPTCSAALWPTELEQIWSHLEPVSVSDTRFEFQAKRLSARAISQPLSLVQDREIEGDRSSEMLRNCYRELTSSQQTNKQTPWSESRSELYRPSDHRLSAKWLLAFVDRGCHAVSVTDPYGRILGFLDRSRYFSMK